MRNKVEHFKSRYLSLINCKELINTCPSIDSLAKIMENHLYHIHFSGFFFLNMDISVIELDPYKLLHNQFSNHQGGICFELHSALHELLKHLGYKAHLVEVMMNHINDMELPSYDVATHSVIIVELDDEKYLVDIGMGNYLHQPVAFSKEHQEYSGKYRVITIDESNQTFQLVRFSNKHQQWLSQYRFSIIDKNPIDFMSNLEKICDKDFNFYYAKEFFMVKPYAHDSYEIIDGAYGKKLVWINNTPNRKERKKIVLDEHLARQMLTEKFHMKAEHINIVLSQCKVQTHVEKAKPDNFLKLLWKLIRNKLST